MKSFKIAHEHEKVVFYDSNNKIRIDNMEFHETLLNVELSHTVIYTNMTKFQYKKRMRKTLIKLLKMITSDNR